MTIDVREAGPDDAPSIARAHVNGWRQAYVGLVPQDVLDGLDVDERTALWRSILTGELTVDGGDPPVDVVAEVDGSVVGFANVGFFRDEPDDETAGELWSMYVDPAHWGVGAGYALMERAMVELRRLGAARAHLWVLDGNDRAQRFYERQGWVNDGVVKMFEIGGAEVTELRYSCVVPDEDSRTT